MNKKIISAIAAAAILVPSAGAINSKMDLRPSVPEPPSGLPHPLAPSIMNFVPAFSTLHKTRAGCTIDGSMGSDMPAGALFATGVGPTFNGPFTYTTTTWPGVSPFYWNIRLQFGDNWVYTRYPNNDTGSTSQVWYVYC